MLPGKALFFMMMLLVMLFLLLLLSQQLFRWILILFAFSLLL